MEKRQKEKGQAIGYSAIIDILKGLSGLVILTYFLGFIVVGFHMMRYSCISLDLLKARYVGAGVLYVFSLGITLAFCLEVHTRLVSSKKEVTKSRYGLTQGLGLLGVIVFAFLSYFIILEDPKVPDMSRVLAWFVVSYLLQSMIVGDVLDEMRHIRHSSFKFTISAIVLQLCFLFVFSRLVYPVVPSSFIGGKPENVKLLLNNSNLVESLPFKRDGQYSEHLQLLDTTNKGFLLFLRIQGKKMLFELDRDLVKGVIYGVEEKSQKADTTSMPVEDETNKNIDQAPNGYRE